MLTQDSLKTGEGDELALVGKAYKLERLSRAKKNSSKYADWVLQSPVAKSPNSEFAFKEVRPAATETSGAEWRTNGITRLTRP